MNRTLRMLLEYDGTRFHGWQRQLGLRTVQGELEEALATVSRHPVSLVAAGRTDRGVHALGQVASFRTPCALEIERLRRGANALTGNDLVVRELIETRPDFHARHDARGRHYAYLLLREPSALWGGRAVSLRRLPDAGRMAAAAAALVGEHDFTALSCKADDERSTRCRVFYARWEPWARGWVLRVGATRFLYHMVRCIVAHCLEIGYGRAEVDHLGRLLEAPAQRCRLVAPARGLHLMSVDYEDTEGCGTWGPDCAPPGPVL